MPLVPPVAQRFRVDGAGELPPGRPAQPRHGPGQCTTAMFRMETDA